MYSVDRETCLNSQCINKTVNRKLKHGVCGGKKIRSKHISSLRDGTNPKAVARELHAASQGLGFIYIKGHGIPEAVIKSARANALAFFAQSEATKSTVKVSQKHRGWLGQGGAKMKDGAKADLKESFIWGHEDAAGKTLEDHPLRGANQWPDQPPAMQEQAMAYFNHAAPLTFITRPNPAIWVRVSLVWGRIPISGS